MNRFVRFLVHTAMIAALFLFFGLVGADIDNDTGGSVSTMSLYAVFGVPLFIILQLAFDTLEDVDNIIVSFLRGALVVIGLVAVGLSFLMQQGVYANQDAGTISNVFLASIMASFPLAVITGAYFYIGLQFTDAKWKCLIAPICGILVSFVINLICVLLGKYVSPFFDGWFLFALVGVLMIVAVIALIKCGDSWTEKMYPSDSPRPKTPAMSEEERKLRVFLDDFKRNPKEYLKYEDITYYTPWSYTLNVSSKRIYFTGAFAVNGYQPSKQGEQMMNKDVEEVLNKGLEYVAKSNSYYSPYSWSVTANMTMR